MQKLGAHIIIEDKFAQVSGVEALKGTSVMAEDLRGGAALAAACLAAEEPVCLAVMNISAAAMRISAGIWPEQEPASNCFRRRRTAFQTIGEKKQMEYGSGRKKMVILLAAVFGMLGHSGRVLHPDPGDHGYGK